MLPYCYRQNNMTTQSTHKYSPPAKNLVCPLSLLLYLRSSALALTTAYKCTVKDKHTDFGVNSSASLRAVTGPWLYFRLVYNSFIVLQSLNTKDGMSFIKGPSKHHSMLLNGCNFVIPISPLTLADPAFILWFFTHILHSSIPNFRHKSPTTKNTQPTELLAH